jgi:hypothetical protein
MDKQFGLFLRRNSYALRDYVPDHVVFLAGGNLKGREDPYFDASTEISPELLSEWRLFHEQRDRHPLISVHFPLEGTELLLTIGRLGVMSNNIGLGVDSYLNALKRMIPINSCFIPSPILVIIDNESKDDKTPLPSDMTERVIQGAWLSKLPQSAWSKEQVNNKGEKGFLSYASIYPAKKEQWDLEVVIKGPRPTPRRHNLSLTLKEWLSKARSSGMRIVPILAASEEAHISRRVALQSEEKEEPKGIIYQNLNSYVPVPYGWWQIGESSQGNFILER